jgi:Fe-Mn family superoxide dismutase
MSTQLLTSRRGVLSTLAGASVGAFAFPALAQDIFKPRPRPREESHELPGIFDDAKGEFVLPPLPYKPDALEPHVDTLTMETHHSKHHAAYVVGANKALRELTSIRDGGDTSQTQRWVRELAFHLSGHINHALFWHMMAPAGKKADHGMGGGEPTGKLRQAIERDFGSLPKFFSQFIACAQQVRSNGWVWLVREPFSGRLMLTQVQSQEDGHIPGASPILGIDVWEHAYYVMHQNKRSDWIEAFLQVVNWDFCSVLNDRASGRV